jgi:hypothetical protein
MNQEQIDRIAQIKERIRKGTPGPWKVYAIPNPFNDLGKKTFPDVVRDNSEVHIATEWNHGQLGGPAPVVTTGVSPYFERSTTVSISAEDAEIIGNAPQDIKWLLNLLEG